MQIFKSASMVLDQGSEFEKAHIPLTKCFALSDFGWGSLCSALPGPKARGQRWVYMIVQFRMILSFILKKRSKKRQASSSKQRLTMAQG